MNADYQSGIIYKDWVNMWLETYKKPYVEENTYRFTYEIPTNNYLIPTFGEMDLTSIKPICVQTFFNSNSNLSQSVLDKFHMILISSFRAAIDNGFVAKNPVSYVHYKSRKEKSVKKVYTFDQIECIKRDAFDLIPEATFVLETGIRRGELCGIHWDDINLANQSVSINRSIADKRGGGFSEMPPKWNSYRQLPLSPMAIELINSLPERSNCVFPNKNGTQQGPAAFSGKLKRYMKTVNSRFDIPPLTAHELRHTYGTNLRRLGVDIYTIQKLMGHKDINMTAEIYVHNELEELRKNLGY